MFLMYLHYDLIDFPANSLFVHVFTNVFLLVLIFLHFAKLSVLIIDFDLTFDHFFVTLLVECYQWI
jgi:hypothetical protein